VPADHLLQLQQLGGPDGVSCGLRLVVATGLAALDGQSPSLSEAVDHLHRVAAELASITGRRTPAGAWWAPSEAAAPEPDQIDARGDVVVAPHGVALVAGAAALSVDFQAGQLGVVDAGRELVGAIDVQLLAPAVALIAPALLGLAAAGPGRRELGCGLAIERLGNNEVAITLQGIGPVVPAAVAWQWAAEMLSLVARGFAASVATRCDLERQLQEVAG
jgi:hypothetical protein